MASSVSDVSAFQQTEFYRKLENNTANLPNPTNLPHTENISSYFIVGDGIFTLRPYMMVPFRRNRRLTRLEELFNYRLSKARQTIECAFGILSARWQILQNKMAFKLSTSIAVVQAVVCLHNFIITRELATDEDYRNYFPERMMEQLVRRNRAGDNNDISDDEFALNDDDENNVANVVNDNINEQALRNLLAEYFLNH
ncbi:uncharacterized protein LOC127291632 [Leptopilina boulardi]|uniref:uncharacterized protein LOC127291632 n=1 Tax=Leptopilina boulardi TaxID=63433 RepID=UPI0021F588C4|nr:uncharacterized protein LOC127291632 [Leptopilina boulardi]